MTPLRIRAEANAVATCTNWLFNFLVVMVTPPGQTTLGWRFYIIWAVFNAAFIPIVYFFYPETRGRSLEEMDLVFAKAHTEGRTAVSVAKDMPRVQGKELVAQMVEYFGDEKAAELKRERVDREDSDASSMTGVATPPTEKQETASDRQQMNQNV